MPRDDTSCEIRQSGFSYLVAASRKGRLAQFGVVVTVAAICLLIGFLSAGRLGFTVARLGFVLSAVRAEAGVEEIRFVLPLRNATAVSVAGDFTSWEPMALSDEDGDGIWTASIPLPPGRYEYAFIIDGHWWGHDPLADAVVPSFGEYNSVRYVWGGDGA